jgi:hypothetical protein
MLTEGLWWCCSGCPGVLGQGGAVLNAELRYQGLAHCTIVLVQHLSSIVGCGSQKCYTAISHMPHVILVLTVAQPLFVPVTTTYRKQQSITACVPQCLRRKPCYLPGSGHCLTACVPLATGLHAAAHLRMSGYSVPTLICNTMCTPYSQL